MVRKQVVGLVACTGLVVLLLSAGAWALRPCVAFASASDRNAQWARVRDALNKGLPRTAIESLRLIETDALRDRAYPEATKAIVLRIRLESSLQADQSVEGIPRLEAEIADVPSPMRPVMEAIVANWYWQYFLENRRRFLKRSKAASQPGSEIASWDLPRIYAEIDTHFTRALAAPASLRRLPISAYDSLLVQGTAPKTYRPTVYDFVAHQALVFYGSGEQVAVRPEDAFEVLADGPIFGTFDEFLGWRVETADSTSPAFRAIRLYQDLLRFHASDVDPSARVDADLFRLRFGWNQATGQAKSSRYMAALERLTARYPDHELSARAFADWAQVLHREDKPAEAWDIAQRGVARFPESQGGILCHNLIHQIEARSLAVTTERVWSDSANTLEVSYRNLNHVYFRVVPVDVPDLLKSHRFVPLGMKADELKTILARPATLEWSAPLPGTPDYRERRERLATPKGLAPGAYYLVASDSTEFDGESPSAQITVFWVTDLALVVRGWVDRGFEGFVLDAVSGAPLSGVDIRSWTRLRDPEYRTGPTTVTDRDGRFRLEGGGEFRILASRGAHQLLSIHPHWSGGSDRRDPTSFQQTLLFTDRAVYRPGQVIRFKGLCTETDPDRNRYEVLRDKSLMVVFRDANDKEVERQEHRTNDLGSFSGFFTAPAGRLLGGMSITIEDGPQGYATVRVEEYKRPGFRLSLERPNAPSRLGSEVTITGTASAYTGSPIDGARVMWYVSRMPAYAAWWQSARGRSSSPTESQQIAHGSTTTRANGTFTIAFHALADPNVVEDPEAVFAYGIHADVTDPSGETRSEDLLLHVGVVSSRAMLAADPWQISGHATDITVRTETLNGRPIPSSGELSIYRLRNPSRVQRAPASERFNLRPLRTPRPMGEEADSTGPDPAGWAEDGSVHTQSLAIDSAGTARVAVPLPAGAYRVQFLSHDPFGKVVTASLSFLVLEPQSRTCPIHVPDLFVAEKWTAEPGQEWLALWGSGYADARAYVEVEHRGKKLQAFWTQPGRTQVAIRQRVTESMRGGFIVRVTMVHDNRAYLHENRVEVPWSNKELAVRWERFVSKLEPGARETWSVVVTPPDGKRSITEMVATLYDASLDAYQSLSWPSLRWGFRQEFRISEAVFENSATTLWPMKQERSPTEKRVEFSYPHLPVELMWRGPLNQDWGMVQAARVMRSGRLTSSSVQGLSVALPWGLPSAPSEVSTMDGLHARGGRSEEIEFQQEESADSLMLAGLGARPDRATPPRRNLQETAFFFPQLTTNERGELRMEFTMPEALTEWRLLGFAHDRELRSGFLEGRAVTSREVMVRPNPPRFVREGDVIEFTAKVTNQSKTRKTGQVSLDLSDAATGESAHTAFGVRSPEQAFDVPALESRTVSWRLSVPEGARVLTFRVVAATSAESDGEEGYLPVLSRRVLVTESLPLPIRGPGTKEFDFGRLRLASTSASLRHQALTVQMVSNPSWYAVMALPYLAEFPLECTEQTFNRLYANALARHIAASNPGARRTFEQWRGSAALDSPLERNDDLKAVLLDETPWLRSGQTESRARRDVGILFDDNRLDAETVRLERKLKELQAPDGSWPWFPGGQPNDYITLYIASGFGRLRHLGVKVDSSAAIRALGRMDLWSDRAYREIVRNGHKNKNQLSPTVALYLYARSFFLKDKKLPEAAQEAGDFWLAQGRRNWPALSSRQSQAHLALALSRFGDDPTAREIMRSLHERAVQTEELGMFWRDEEISWWWHRAPIETQAVLIEAFDEVMHDSAAVEACKTWLLKQKQTRDWKTTKATADAVYALLLRGVDALASDALVKVALGGTAVSPANVEVGTGFYEKRFSEAEITPALARVSVQKDDAGIAWGSVHWQYLEELERLTPYAGTPLSLRKSLHVRTIGRSGPELVPLTGAAQVGDELVVRIVLRTDRDMEYVHLKDNRGSGVEPARVLAGYRYRDGLAYYEETRDTASHFYIEYLPKGTYVFEYSTRVQHRGSYQSGMAQIQCMYAPEFNSHSESFVVDVR